MQDQLDALEGKLVLLLERHKTALDENTRLRQQVISMENTHKRLTERLEETRLRLEALHARIPD